MLRTQAVPEWMKLAVCGYIRKHEERFNLYMVIPIGIYDLVLLLFPKLLRWNLFSTQRFKVSADGFTLSANTDSTVQRRCAGYTVFPEVLFPNGYTEGVHYWSVKRLPLEDHSHFCYHSIGVVLASKRNNTVINQITDEWCVRPRYNNKNTSCYVGNQGSMTKDSPYWCKDEVMTVKLNCDEGTVEYFKDDQLKQTDTVHQGKAYYFALNTCGSRPHFEIVETPESVLKSK